MSLFSQRKGLKPLEKALQRDSLDEATRNRMWSVLKLSIWDKWQHDPRFNWEASTGKKPPMAFLLGTVGGTGIGSFGGEEFRREYSEVEKIPLLVWWLVKDRVQMEPVD
jgi:hypothetical protein